MNKEQISSIIEEKVQDLVDDLENEFGVLIDFETLRYFEHNGNQICQITFEKS